MLLENEKLVEAVSTHWMKYVLPFALMLLLVSVAIVVIALPTLFFNQLQVGVYTPFFSGLILLTLIVHWGFHRLLNESMIDVIITNRRVIYLQSSPLINDVMREFHMERMRAVEGRKVGLLQNIFDYGSLSVNTEGSGFHEEQSIVQFMPHPNRYSQKIIVAMEEAGLSKIGKKAMPPTKLPAIPPQQQAERRVFQQLRKMRKKLTGR